MTDKLESYRIQHPDGRFSRGGAAARFSANGKTWSRVSDVLRHLALLDQHNLKLYKGCTLISEVYELRSRESTSVDTIIANEAARGEAKFRDHLARRQAAEERMERLELARLRAKYEGLRGDPD